MDDEEEPDMRLCRVCREEKFLADFPPTGTACRACNNAQRVQWAHSTPERHANALQLRRDYVKRRKAAPGSHTEAEWRARVAQYRGTCAYCGRADRALVKEHIVPVLMGGTDDIANIVPACQPCNARKNARTDMVPRLPPGPPG